MSWIFSTTINKRYLDLAFEWYMNSSPFLLALSEQYLTDDKDIFLKEMKNGINFIGIENGIPKALVHGEIKSKDVIEGHLFCTKTPNLDFLINTCIFAKNRSLERYKMITCHVLRKHKILHTIMSRSGFIDSGLRSYQNVYKDRLQEVLYYYSIN